MFVFVNICDVGKIWSTTNMFVFDEQVNHVKQNANMFQLF